MRQPWLNTTAEPPTVKGAPDDFSPRSATVPLHRAAVVVAIGYALLLAGRSEPILDAVYGLPVLPGTNTLIELAEAWNDGLALLGIPEAAAAIRGWLATGR